MEKIEAVYKLSDIVNQVWVYGNSFESSVVAVVVPVDTGLAAWASKNNISGTHEVGSRRALLLFVVWRFYAVWTLR